MERGRAPGYEARAPRLQVGTGGRRRGVILRKRSISRNSGGKRGPIYSTVTRAFA